MTRRQKTGSEESKAGAAKGPVVEIIVAVAIALLVGSTAPWWWSKLFPPSPPPVAECSPDNLKAQLRLVPADKTAVIEASARTMRERFRLQDFDCVYGLAAVLLQDDQDSGHGLYYSGEVWRVRAKQNASHTDSFRGRMREHFFRYLSIEADLPATERDGKAEACYRRSKGYCTERTAFISHLMAVDYYQQAQDATQKSIKIQRLQRADHFLEKDLQFGGFDQIIPSSVLKSKIEEELQTADAQQGTPADRPAAASQRQDGG